MQFGSQSTQLPQTAANAVHDGTPYSANDVPILNMDMALAIDQYQLNQIALQSEIDPLSFSFSWDANCIPSAQPVYIVDGMMIPMDTGAQSNGVLYCGGVGDSVGGSGVLWNLTLRACNAVINNNSYMVSGADTWTVQGVTPAYHSTEQSTQVSNATSEQVNALNQAYGANSVQASQFGLDFKHLAYSQSAPPSPWTETDWNDFCNAIIAFVNQSNSTMFPTTQVDLMDGVVPVSANAAWNLGPSAWQAFNVPPLDATSNGAMVFAFTVSDHTFGNNVPGDFANVRLFDPSTTGNVLLFVAGEIVESSIASNLMTPDTLQQAAELGVAVTTDDYSGTQRFNIQSNFGSAPTPSNSSTQPWSMGTNGSAFGTNSYTDKNVFNTANATTTTNASLQFAGLENGFYSQLLASGSYTLASEVDGNQIGYQEVFPTVTYEWSANATMSVGSIGDVSFTPTANAFPDTPSAPPVNPQSTVTWWTSSQGGIIDPVTAGAKNWGTAAAQIAGNSYLVNQPQSTFNMFAFPGGNTYQFAKAGINLSTTMVLDLTYVVS